jgi:hypothetical protein
MTQDKMEKDKITNTNTVTDISNPRISLVPFEGFGVSLNYGETYLYTSCPISEVNKFIDSVFGNFQNPDSLGLTFLRFFISNNDNPEHNHFPYRTGPMSQQNFSYYTKDGKFDASTTDLFSRYILFRAIDNGIIDVDAYIYSAPWYYTKSKCIAGNGSTVETGDNLDVSNYQNYTNYICDTLQFFKDTYNIIFKTISPFNEPTGGWWTSGKGQEGQNFSINGQIKFIPVLYNELIKRGLKTGISTNEGWSLRQTYQSLQHYPKNIWPMIAEVHTHTYDASDVTSFLNVIAKNPKPIRVSEYGFAIAGYEGSVLANKALNNGIGLSKHICTDLNQLNPLSWCLWTMWWGLNRMDPSRTFCESILYTKQYYCYKHFAKYIVYGCTKIDLTSVNKLVTQNAGTVNCVMYCLSRDYLVFVRVNDQPTTLTDTISGSFFDFTNMDLSMYVTDVDRNCEPSNSFSFSNGVITIKADPSSVLTFVAKRKGFTVPIPKSNINLKSRFDSTSTGIVAPYKVKCFNNNTFIGQIAVNTSDLEVSKNFCNTSLPKCNNTCIAQRYIPTTTLPVTTKLPVTTLPVTTQLPVTTLPVTTQLPVNVNTLPVTNVTLPVTNVTLPSLFTTNNTIGSKNIKQVTFAQSDKKTTFIDSNIMMYIIISILVILIVFVLLL